MGQQIQFKASIIAAAISMMAAGPACADPGPPAPTVGNTLVGPELKSVGTTAVKINQSGTGNVTSSNGAAGGDAFVVDQSNGPAVSTATTLTIQQVGTDNTLGLRSYTNANTKIQVFQGADAETGNAGRLGTDATKSVNSNSAGIQIGASGDQRAGATDVFLTQQGHNNIASLFLGRASGAFTGLLNMLQVGDNNFAEVAINGQTTLGQNFNIGQAGDGNLLSLSANGNQSTGMTLDFGRLSFGQVTSLPSSGDTEGNNNARSYKYAGGNVTLKTLFTDSQAGINVLGTDVFKIRAEDGSNNVQVDLAGAAATGNKIDVLMQQTGHTFAVYGKGGAAINLGGSGRLDLAKDLVVYANGGSISVNSFLFEDGHGYLSTSDGGSITINGGQSGGDMSVVQSGAAHSFSSTGNGSFSQTTLNVAQSGPEVNSLLARTENDAESSFTLVQASEAEGSGHSMTLVNALDSAIGRVSWSATQSGAGAKTLVITSDTRSAVISATQTGSASQSATGINFAAASGSTFTLVQR